MDNLLMWGIIAHLLADWPLQNHWMATNKANLKHPAAWVHGGIHLLVMLLVFPLPYALLIATAHILIDTRKPFHAWSHLMRQTTEGVYAIHVAIWEDQVFHVLVIAAVTLLYQVSAIR